MEFVTFGKRKIPVVLARGILQVINYLAPLSKFNRDLAEVIFNHDNKKKK